MNKFGEVLAISDLKKVDDNELTRKLNSSIEKLDLEVGTSQKKSWKECIKYLKETFKYTDRYDDIYILLLSIGYLFLAIEDLMY